MTALFLVDYDDQKRNWAAIEELKKQFVYKACGSIRVLDSFEIDL